MQADVQLVRAYRATGLCSIAVQYAALKVCKQRNKGAPVLDISVRGFCVQRLDVEFPERPLFPTDPALIKAAEAMVEAERPLSSAGYRYLRTESEAAFGCKHLRDFWAFPGCTWETATARGQMWDCSVVWWLECVCRGQFLLCLSWTLFIWVS